MCVCEREREGWGCLRSIRQGFWCVYVCGDGRFGVFEIEYGVRALVCGCVCVERGGGV